MNAAESSVVKTKWLLVYAWEAKGQSDWHVHLRRGL